MKTGGKPDWRHPDGLAKRYTSQTPENLQNVVGRFWHIGCLKYCFNAGYYTTVNYKRGGFPDQQASYEK